MLKDVLKNLMVSSKLEDFDCYLYDMVLKHNEHDVNKNGYISTRVEAAIDALFDAYKNQKRIFIIGNGGSASAASHLAQDLAKGTTPGYHDLRDYDMGTLKAISLCDNISFITAIANDDGYEHIFTDQLKAHSAMPDDVLIIISGSGNSKNVVNAARWASGTQMKVISFTGFDGGRIKNMSSIAVHFPVNDMCMTEAYHSIMFHYIAEKIKHLRILEKNINKQTYHATQSST